LLPKRENYFLTNTPIPGLNPPHHHKDPFDRLIICQAMIERIPIMTVDRQFEPYDVKVLRGD
jgi:PIN domain nuclease of toxin-antitoxin system